MIDEVCDIIGHHHTPRPCETDNFKVVYDADLIVDLEDAREEKPLSADTVTRIVERRFLTPRGRNLAIKLFFKNSAQ